GQPLPQRFIPAPQPPYADFMARFAARLIDSVVLSPLLLGWGVMVFWAISQIPKDPKLQHPEWILLPIIAFGLCWLVVSLVANWLYHALLDSSDRQGTVGKRVMGLVVTGVDG